MLQNVFEIGVIKARSCLFVLFNILKELQKNLQAGIGDVSHSMLECPYYTVQDELELLWGYAQEGGEAIVVNCL